MRSIHRFLALLGGVVLASTAQAGPNVGGVVIAHVNEGVVYTGDNSGYCGQSGLEECSAADSRVDGTDLVVFYVVAAFPGSPRLAGLTFGIDYDPADIVLVEWGACGEFELTDGDWPAPGSGVAVTWGEAQTDRAIECYWFAGYSYTGNPTEFRVTEHPARGSEPYFADDDVPSNLDTAIDTGSLGFNMDGYLPCASDRSCDLVLSPSQVTAYQPCGGSFPVDLDVIDVEDLGDFSVCVGYDGSQLSLESVVIDPGFLGSTGRTVTPVAPVSCNSFYHPSGVRIRATTSGTPDGPTGSGRLAQIFFSTQGTASGEGGIGLGDWLLRDTESPPGLVYVGGVSEMNVTYYPYCYGDYNGDGDVTVFDLSQIIQRWPGCSGDPGYDARFDVNLIEEGNYCASTPDGCVDVVDIQTIGGRWHLGCGDGLVGAEPNAAIADHRPVVPTVRISPAFSVLGADIGDTTSVALVIEDASDLGGFEAELAFDPAVFQVSDVDLGSLLGATGRTTYALPPQIDNEEGVVRFGSCTVGLVPGATDSGVLARVVFEIVDCEATTAVAISGAIVTNTPGWPQELGGTTDGSIEIHCASSSVPAPPGARELAFSIRPNPSSSATEIAFSVPANAGEAVPTRLEVFDASGRLVRTLLHETLPSGPHSVTWDARDGAGNNLPGGAFFCRLRVGDRTVQEQVVLTR